MCPPCVDLILKPWKNPWIVYNLSFILFRALKGNRWSFSPQVTKGLLEKIFALTTFHWAANRTWMSDTSQHMAQNMTLELAEAYACRFDHASIQVRRDSFAFLVERLRRDDYFQNALRSQQIEPHINRVLSNLLSARFDGVYFHTSRPEGEGGEAEAFETTPTSLIGEKASKALSAMIEVRQEDPGRLLQDRKSATEFIMSAILVMAVHLVVGYVDPISIYRARQISSSEHHLVTEESFSLAAIVRTTSHTGPVLLTWSESLLPS
jgi:hypothetical protein